MRTIHFDRRSGRVRVNDAGDNLALSVPLLIKILEFARENAKTDEELHVLVEKLWAKSNNGTRELSMKDYVADSESTEEREAKALEKLADIEELKFFGAHTIDVRLTPRGVQVSPRRCSCR